MRDEQPPFHLIALLLDGADLVEHRHRIEHHAVTDDTGDPLMEDPTGHQMEDERLIAPTDGVACIGSALIARHDVNLITEQVHDLALSFVAPLASNNNSNRHSFIVLRRQHP